MKRKKPRPKLLQSQSPVVGRFDVEAALRRHLAIPPFRDPALLDRRYAIRLTHDPKA
ncbi:MAG: hypothetical protein ABSF73_09510 [Terriglobia bacterium]|jgi:hypothetical protein